MRVIPTLKNFYSSGHSIRKSWTRGGLLDIAPSRGKSLDRGDDATAENLQKELKKLEDMKSQSEIRDWRDDTLPIQRLEAALLVAQEPLAPRKLVLLADLADATQVRTLTRELNKQYKDFGHAFSIEEVAGGYILLTRKQFAPWIKKNQLANPTEHLSQSALETLAIVAYRQPVLRVDIEAIRGLSCDEVLRQLMEKDLVKISGRSEDLGRPYLYGTTKRFLQLFGLYSLDKLPRVEWLRATESKITNLPTEENDLSVSVQVT